MEINTKLLNGNKNYNENINNNIRKNNQGLINQPRMRMVSKKSQINTNNNNKNEKIFKNAITNTI